MKKEIIWYKLAGHINEIDFAANNIAVVTVANKKICLAKFKEQLFAFAYKCPHAGGILAEGSIDALGNVVCPLHRYKYSLKNGHNVSGEGFYLKHWRIEKSGEEIFVGLEPLSFWNLFK
ncbi:MAG: (2Fe-2S)-binding protein [Chitinophagaceae bacterium]